MILPTSSQNKSRETSTACAVANKPAADKPADMDLPRLRAAVREMLLAMGEDPDREGLIDTPKRVAKSFLEIYGGLHQDPELHLGRVFAEGNNDPVVVRDITFYSMCEHHLLPIEGKVHIAYQPSEGRVVGLSKLARTVEVFARRPQLQERLTNQIADAIAQHMDPAGVLVLVEADHFCMKMRGIQSPCANTVTMSTRGIFKESQSARAEMLSLIHSGRK